VAVQATLAWADDAASSTQNVHVRPADGAELAATSAIGTGADGTESAATSAIGTGDVDTEGGASASPADITTGNTNNPVGLDGTTPMISID